MHHLTNEVVRILEEECRPFLPKEVERVVRERDLNPGWGWGMYTLIQEVVREGAQRTAEALDELYNTFGYQFDYVALPEKENLEKRAQIIVHYYPVPGVLEPQGRSVTEVMIEHCTRNCEKTFHKIPLRHQPHAGEFFVRGRAGLVELYIPHKLITRGKRVFLRLNSEEELKSLSKTVRSLTLFLERVGISDLADAAEAFTRMKEGEVWEVDSYVLAKGKGLWALRREPVFYEPELDGPLLLGKPVNLFFPGGVGIAFRASWRLSSERVALSDVEVRLGEEVLRFPKRGFFGDILDENPVLQALKRGFAKTLDAFRKGAGGGFPLEKASTDMRIFLRAFVEHEDPLGALAEGGFLPHAKAKLFLDL